MCTDGPSPPAACHPFDETDGSTPRMPQLASGVKLHRDVAAQAWLLDDGMQRLKLNLSAGAILARCDGHRSIEQLIGELEELFQTSDIGAEVREFLAGARDRGWIG
jgi:pyrroloquinoline quinone biosynthesis protein D